MFPGQVCSSGGLCAPHRSPSPPVSGPAGGSADLGRHASRFRWAGREAGKQVGRQIGRASRASGYMLHKVDNEVTAYCASLTATL